MANRRWTRELVLEALRDRVQHRLSLACTYDKRLYDAGRRHFGSWQAALAAAGLALPRIARSKEQVVEALRNLHEQGIAVSAVRRRDAALYHAASVQFGGWHQALAAAGLPLPKPNWTQQRIVEALRDRHARGLPVSRIPKDDPSFRSAICNHFGSFYRALTAAGIPGVRPPRRWSPQSVAAAIRTRHQQGLPLERSQVDDLGLRQAAALHYGSWEGALIEAGFPGKDRWTKSRVVQAIRQRHEQGLSLANMRFEDGVLYRVARKYCGGWNQALQAAGLDTKPNRCWTKPQLIEAIRSRHSEGLASKLWKLDRSFVHSATRRFGSWPDALREAGVPLYRNSWNRSAIVMAIQRRVQDGVPLAQVWKYDNALYAAAKQHFGTWREALLAAGLRCGRMSWTRQRVAEVIQQRLQQGERLTDLRKDNALACAAGVYYGSWSRALSAAGVEYQPPRRWSKKSVIHEIQRRHQQGLTLVSSRSEIWALTSAAERQFGSWSRALEVAGVEPNLPRWSKRKVIEEIHLRYKEQPRNLSRRRHIYLQAIARRFFDCWADALAAAGVIPSRDQIVGILQDHFIRGRSLEVLRQQNPALAAAARKIFGSWQKAVRAAGLREGGR